MGTASYVERERRVSRAARELASVARELARHCRAADLAVARDDFDVICESSEAAHELHRRWSDLYRELLVARTTSRPQSER